ncbi:Dihydroorotase [Polystyrenella longa]|uniref:Dihydroorotase n=1 Tax=Polystyrenella longa TaxID=2528007 RepID=A0A518CQ66_9PLAN|nr:dihydroorotase [Polystyrenella longa]QDU81368.1 Dihydroorotase [Polystyrenella longa]
MNSILIRQGRLIDPSQKLDRTANLFIENGKITRILDEDVAADEVIEAAGCIVTPGFIDTHVAVREPGDEEDETVASVSNAAIHGGFTTICTLPDTQPVVDNRAAAEFIHLQAERAGYCHVSPLGAITKNNDSEELAEIGQLVDGGVLAFTDGKKSVANSEIMRRALEYTRMFNRPIFHHPQVPEMVESGVMHEGFHSMKLGLRGMPNAAEEIMVSRDIALVELTGGRVHEMCISTRAAVEHIRDAKRAGIAISADVTPHHLALTDAEMEKFDTNYKVSPPLRDKDQIAALIEGLQDGTIEAITADHQPHADEKKHVEVDQAPFGIVGLETALSLCIKTLIDPGHLTWLQLIDKLTAGPARILNLEQKGTLRDGADADVTIFNPDEQWTVDVTKFKTLSKNSPFAGWELRGRIKTIIVNGLPRTL